MAKPGFAEISRIRAWLLLPLFALAWSSIAQAELPIETRTLPNGLQLIVLPDTHAEKLNLTIWYKAGAGDEVAGKTGIAHYTEHLMFRSTALTGSGLAKTSAALQADNNAFTVQDRTVYTDMVSLAELPGVLAVESQRMKTLTLADDAGAELKVVQAERRWRYDTKPSALMRLEGDGVLYAGHPYARPVIGTPDDIAHLTVPDSIAFHERWYAPNNAIVILGGATAPDEAFRLLESAFGDLAQRPIPARDWPAMPIHFVAPAGPLHTDDPHHPGRSFQRRFRAPSYGLDGPRAVYATRILLQALIGVSDGELPRTLEDHRQLAQQVTGYYDAAHLGPGELGLSVYMAPGADQLSAQEALDFVLQQMVAQGVADGMVELLKRRWIDRERYAEDDAAATAREIGEIITSGGTLEQYRRRLDDIAAVTPADVAAAARQVLGGPGILLEERKGEARP